MLDLQPECSAAAPWKADAGILRSALRLRCRICGPVSSGGGRIVKLATGPSFWKMEKN